MNDELAEIVEFDAEEEIVSNPFLDNMDPISQLSKDLKGASRLLSQREVRYLVDLYYTLQEYRIATSNQNRALQALDEPNQLILWALGNFKTLEKNIAGVMDKYTMVTLSGRWMRSITGIGPVLAAGLLGHIEIEKAPTAGQIWRYAGYDPSVEWLGRERSKDLVNKIVGTGKVTITPEHLAKCARAVNRNFDNILRQATEDTTSLVNGTVLGWHSDEDEDIGIIRVAPGTFEPDEHEGETLTLCFGQRRLSRVIQSHSDEEIRVNAILPDQPADPITFEVLTAKITKAGLINALAKRPWNSKLKTLCWKIGESFVKVSNNPKDFYGKVYAKRKVEEAAKNEEGEYAEQARAKLERFNITAQPTRGIYESGKLPPAHLHERAKRYAVKLFLSHLHHVLHVEKIGFMPPPPRPYIVEHGG
ncbi:MAG: TIGR-Tas system RNA-guided endonuclease, partial [Planctomycetota bacterium]